MYVIAAIVAAFFLVLLSILIVHVYLLPQYFLRFLISQSHSSVFWCALTNTRVISLTIDDAPTKSTSEILDILKRFDVKATFFIISGQIPGYEHVMKRIVAEGHTLGNHLTEDRPSILDDIHTFEKKILTCESYLQKYQPSDKTSAMGTKRKARKWLRPASGWFTGSMRRVIQHHGYRLCLASVYPHDAQIRSELINSLYVKFRTRCGSVLLLHDRPWTVGLLKRVLPFLCSKFRFVSLDELADLTDSQSKKTTTA